MYIWLLCFFYSSYWPVLNITFRITSLAQGKYDCSRAGEANIKGMVTQFVSIHRHTLDDVITWKHFPRHRPFFRGIHQWLVFSPKKGQKFGTLMFSLSCVWTTGWAKNHQWGSVALTCNKSHRMCPTYQFVELVFKIHLWISFYISQSLIS